MSRIISSNFTTKGIVPHQVVDNFRSAIASEYRLAQANKVYNRFSFFFKPVHCFLVAKLTLDDSECVFNGFVK